MNILVLNYEYPPLGGGAAPVSRDISEHLVQGGNQVTVVTMAYKNLPHYELQNGVEIHRVKCLRSKQFSCMPWEQLTYIISAIRFIQNKLDIAEFDLCYTHFIIPTGVVARYLHRKFSVPVVITAHGSDVEGYNSKKYMKVMHWFLRKSWRSIVDETFKVVSPSEFLYNLMMKAYGVPTKYTVIPNGVDLSRYSALAGIHNKKKKILLMGRMQEYKNFQTAIKAIALCDLGDWSVEVLGNGPYCEELRKLVYNLNLEDKIIFHGWIENSSEEQLRFLREASIYITASRFENCPMAVLETIAAGCYPLLSDIPAHRQLVPEDEFYFRPDDTEVLARKLQHRLDGGECSFVYDLNRYSWDAMMKQYQDVFEEALRQIDVK